MKKIILIILMAIISSCSYYGAVNEKGEKVVDFTTSSQEENVVENETTEETQENIINQVEETVAQAEIMQNVETEVQETTKEQTTTPIAKETSKSENKNKETKQTPVAQPKQEQPNTSVVQTPKKEEKPTPQVQKTLTPDDLEYWCVAGGSHHIAGDGANEHGYYSSWSEANIAFENHTKGWSSVQYKIDTCSCGKYYFWAIQ